MVFQTSEYHRLVHWVKEVLENHYRTFSKDLNISHKNSDNVIIVTNSIWSIILSLYVEPFINWALLSWVGTYSVCELKYPKKQDFIPIKCMPNVIRLITYKRYQHNILRTSYVLMIIRWWAYILYNYLGFHRWAPLRIPKDLSCMESIRIIECVQNTNSQKFLFLWSTYK